MENDTIVGITREQLVLVNQRLSSYKFLKEACDLFREDNLLLDSIVGIQSKQLLKKDSIIQALYVMGDEKDKFYKKELQVTLKEYKSKSRKITIGVGFGGTLLGVLLGVLLYK